MRLRDGILTVTPSDLTDSLACGVLARYTREVAAGARPPPPAIESATADAIRKRAIAHELEQLAVFQNRGLRIYDGREGARRHEDPRERARRTAEAMKEGFDVLYQPTLFDERWHGRPDFFVRSASQSDPPDYEVVDAKLARSATPDALLQLSAYSAQLGRVRGREPREMHLLLGDGRRESFRVAEYAAYFRAAQDRFVESLERAADVPAAYPDPVAHCAICKWSGLCDARRRKDDHLSLVYSLRGDQRRKLVGVGIETMSALAAAADSALPPAISEPTRVRLRAQAKLQVAQRETGTVSYELLPLVPKRGLALLPAPDAGDLFFDMEGDPLVPGGLEYLFGVTDVTDGKPRYRAFWAHDRAAERKALEDFLDLVHASRAQSPALHVFHYGPYEVTALKRLTAFHATREAALDDLLRQEVFVDLLRIVRQGVRVSQDSVSLKKLEPLYMKPRTGAIKDAGSSIAQYEAWLDVRDPALLENIERYNEDDCESTWLLRDWLEARRVDLQRAAGGEVLARPVAREREASEAQTESEVRAAALLAGLPEDISARSPAQEAQSLLANLLDWHRREQRSEWWAYFERLTMTPEELFHDADSIEGLEYVGPVGDVKRSTIHRYRFDPSQQLKAPRHDEEPIDPATERGAGKVHAIDGEAGTIDLLRGKTSKVPHPRALIPPKPRQDDGHRGALAAIGESVLARGIDGDGPYRVSRELLLGRPPRVRGQASGPLVRAGEDPLTEATRIVGGLEEACLPVQGPPGTGKTWTGGRVIFALLEAGKRVAITANGHKVIGKLLDEVLAVARERGALGTVRAIQKCTDEQRCQSAEVTATGDNKEVEDAVAAGKVNLVAGTSWLFVREALVGAFDVLFVDEAGQTSLANAVAVGRAAKSMVLLGDPRQLAQPTKGAHPPGAERSALDHLLHGASTVPDDRGIFLATTRRMHPDVCRFISDAVYDGRLHATAECARQIIGGDDALSGSGLRVAEVAHEGNRSGSDEEARVIAALVGRMLGRTFTSSRGDTRPLTLADMLFVTPYNAQVIKLRAQLGGGAHIGTVDKFQGQEAPVVFYSLATSSADDAPRGMDFLYSVNRLNVAISRAQAMAILVCSPAVRWPACRTPAQMAMANAFCLALERAARIPLDPNVPGTRAE